MGAKWSGVKRSGAVRSGLEWSGLEWSGVEQEKEKREYMCVCGAKRDGHAGGM